ncbi:flavodoxin family protein [Streptomyces sp. NPDC001380]|uniref:flavodoxin family protein n=1 Tax=Streptomyces sp. NPDC001380 TaxID=3364566 RepID=UPI0036AF1DFD
MSRSFLLLLASSRPDGNTELLARAAAGHLPPGTEQRWVRLAERPLPDFSDVRHADGPRAAPVGEEADLLDATLAATDVVIASPLYWYTLSAEAKRYLYHRSGWLRLPGRDFKAAMAGRTLWGVTAMAGDAGTAGPLVGALHHTAAYMGMRFGGVLLGNGTRPGDVLADTGALERAGTFFAREAPLARFPQAADASAG